MLVMNIKNKYEHASKMLNDYFRNINMEDKIMTPKDVLSMIKEKGAKVVDLRFLDFPGVWQHFTVPLSELDESSFEDGFGFDGSSIRGWQPINASDMKDFSHLIAVSNNISNSVFIFQFVS